MSGDAILWLGVAAAVAGVAVLRLAWSQPRRSIALNAAGWGLLLLALLSGSAAAGAWGASIASLFAMGAAAVLLFVAAVRSPAGRGTVSNRRVKMLPEAGEPRRIGRRAATFAIVLLGGLLVSIVFAIGLRASGAALGWSEANSNATALFAVPVIWGVLACVLLMQESRRSQLLTLALCALPILPAALSGA